MRLAITLAGPALADARHLARIPELARLAERLGVDQLGVPDHLVLGRELDGYPFGRFPAPPDNPYPEPMLVSAAVAAATSRIELAPSALIVPLRSAVLLAKTCATLDRLSGGRLVLGAGTGWHRAEFAAAGVPFSGRGARMDDTLRACRVLWRDAPASFSSDTVSFTDVWCEPRPTAPGSIRIWVGGADARRVAARVAEYADGWIPPPGHPAAAIADGVGQIAEMLRQAGRDPSALDVKVALALRDGDVEGTLRRAVPELAAAGVTMVQVAIDSLVGDREQAPAAIERVAAAFAPLRDA